VFSKQYQIARQKKPPACRMIAAAPMACQFLSRIREMAWTISPDPARLAAPAAVTGQHSYPLIKFC